jgi:UDP-glucuronate 4-epimerase
MILVTGAAGFIGSHLCEKLIGQDFKVVGIDNFDPFYDPKIKKRNLFTIENSPNFTFYNQSITDITALEKIFENHKFETIVHLAAKAGVRPSIKQPFAYHRTNIDGTLNLLELSRHHNLGRFVFASSSSVYGNNKVVPFSEDHSVDNPISPYAATKKAGELMCYTYHHLYKINIFNLRFFTVYGPRQRPEMAIHKFIRLIDNSKPIQVYGYGKPKRDFTYIDDIIQGIQKSIEKVEGYEIFNLGESKTISTNGLIELIEKELGKQAFRQEMSMQPGDVEITYADISKAKNVLGYDPKTDLEEGITKMVEWYLNEKRFYNKD